MHVACSGMQMAFVTKYFYILNTKFILLWRTHADGITVDFACVQFCEDAEEPWKSTQIGLDINGVHGFVI